MAHINRLSPTAVRNSKPGMHNDGLGLYLQVTAAKDGTLNRSWIFRFAGSDGRERKMGLGSLDVIGLAEARQKAAECRRLRLENVDPIAAREAQRAAAAVAGAKAITFEKAAAAYIQAHQAGWRSTKHAAQWRSTLAAFVFPVFGHLPVNAVDTGLVMKALEPIWTTKTETAGRVRGRIESILDWAKARGYRHGENPARWRGHLENLLPSRRKVRTVKHLAALPFGEVPEFMAALRSQDGAAARALEFAILTAARSGEVRGARWDEIDDMAENTWTVPASRMKGGREHRVSICGRALAIVEEMRAIRTGDLIFPSLNPAKPIHDRAMLMQLQALGCGNVTTHGFRATFKTWASEQTDFPSEVIEMSLAHSVGNAVERAYQRGGLLEKRRLLMAEWEKFCARPAGSATVTDIRRKAQ